MTKAKENKNNYEQWNVSPRRWKKLLSREANILSKSLVLRGIAHGPRFVLPEWPGMQNQLWTWRDGETGIHLLYDELEHFSDIVVAKALEDSAFVHRYRTESKARCDEGVRRVEVMISDLSNSPTTEEMISGFQTFCISYQLLPETIFMTLEEIQEQVLAQLDAPSDLGALIATPELSIEAEEERDRLRLVVVVREQCADWFRSKSVEEIDRDLSKFSALEQRVNAHVAQYAWIPLNFEKPLWDRRFFLNSIKRHIEEDFDPIPRLEELATHAERVRSEKKPLYGVLDDTTRTLVDLLEAVSFVRMYRATLFSLAYYRAFPLLEAIGKLVGLTLDDLRFTTPDEIIAALRGASQLRPRGDERRNAFAMLTLDGKYSQYDGTDAIAVMGRELPEDKLEEVTELKGMVAYPGVVRGAVRLIFDAREMDKVQDGDILVCEATNPDLVIAMARAGAIVTNEGGITSHAAIVSREMKKPCVIGTKRATKVFRDGELVEVDANKGVIRKLKA